MAYYSSPEDMFAKRALNYKREGDRHWAMAKNGDGDYHYGKARASYNRASENLVRANEAKHSGTTWRKPK